MNRTFTTGANRNDNEGKLSYEGFLSYPVIKAYGEYMHKHRLLEDGTLRDADNWQKLFGDNHEQVCMESAWRHFMDWWAEHRGYNSRDGLDEALGGLIFNAMAYWHKKLLDKEQ